MADTTSPEPLTPEPDPTSAIRVFLLAEVRDYTRFSQERGDEAAVRLVQRFAELMRQVMHTRGGKVIELRGDEALAIFGSARQALRAAAALQERFLEENDRDPQSRCGWALGSMLARRSRSRAATAAVP